MDVNAIKEMIKTMDNSKLGYLEVNWQGISIVMRKQGESDFSPQSRKSDSTIELESEKSITNEPIKTKVYTKEDIVENIEEEAAPAIEDTNVKEVVSPIVGTFYASSSPDKPSYVSLGSKVKKGDTLCIIEAMKLMNEIQSEIDGEIVEILVDDQQMVEYGQPMFKIKAE
jgi:acetyl-CoA carboxylase biotin carboxyl carrier protein